MGSISTSGQVNFPFAVVGLLLGEMSKPTTSTRVQYDNNRRIYLVCHHLLYQVLPKVTPQSRGLVMSDSVSMETKSFKLSINLVSSVCNWSYIFGHQNVYIG